MIWESWHWKRPLIETAQRLRALKDAAEPSEEQFVQLEKDIFIGFYSVRKLFETQTKVTDVTRATKLEVSWHANKGKRVTWRNNHKLDELYDLSQMSTEIRDAGFICGRIIHSFVFAPVIGDKGLEAVLFTSDTDKDKRLYSLHIDRVIELFELVGNDDPTEVHWQRDPDTDEEITVVK